MLVMDGIKEFEFNEHGLQKLKELPKVNNLGSVSLLSGLWKPQIRF